MKYGLSLFRAVRVLQIESLTFSCGCCSSSFPIAFAASTPKVFPSRINVSTFLFCFNAEIISSAENQHQYIT